LQHLKDGTKEPGTAQFRVCWDKVRAGGPKRKVREVVATLINGGPKEVVGTPKSKWEFEVGDLGLFDDLKEKLQDGAFINQKEIADYCGLSKPMGKAKLDRRLKLGLWREDEISQWFGKGKTLRNLGKTRPPIRPDTEWMTETFPDDGDDRLRRVGAATGPRRSTHTRTTTGTARRSG
jgi:hypothetical protein